MSPTGVSRRRALQVFGVAGVAGIASGGVAASAAGASSTSAPAQAGDAVTSLPSFGIVGMITDIHSDRFILRVGVRSLVIVPIAEASIYSGQAGRVTGVAALIVGDRVFVQGEDKGDGTIAASSVGSVYDNVVLKVASVDPAAQLVTTNKGILHLNGKLPDLGRVSHRLPAGVSVTATTWTDPRDKRTYLLLADSDRIS